MSRSWTGQRHEIEGRDRNGRLRTLLRWPEVDRTVRPREIELWKEDRLAELPSERRDAIRTQLDRSSFSDVYPTHGGFLAGPEGEPWVAEYRRPTTRGPRRWCIFDREGTLRATAELPEDATARAVGDDRVFVIERDESDVERVRVYPPVGVEQGE